MRAADPGERRWQRRPSALPLRHPPEEELADENDRDPRGGCGGPVLADRVAFLSERLASSRSNPFDKPVRLIDVRIDSGKAITLLRRPRRAGHKIAALYKQRWQVELFFKWIKQNLKIRHFLGASENAVRNPDHHRPDCLPAAAARAGRNQNRGLQAIARPRRPSSAEPSPISSNHPRTTQNPMTNSKSPSPKSKPDSSGSSGMTRRIRESGRLPGAPHRLGRLIVMDTEGGPSRSGCRSGRKAWGTQHARRDARLAAQAVEIFKSSSGGRVERLLLHLPPRGST